LLKRSANIGLALLALPTQAGDSPPAATGPRAAGPTAAPITATTVQANTDRARRVAEESRKYIQKQEGIELFCFDEPIFDIEDARRAASLFRRSGVDAVVVLHGGATPFALTLELLHELTVPVALWGIPEPQYDGTPVTCGSMAGLISHAAALTALGRKFTFVYGLADSAEARRQLDKFILTTIVRRALRGASIAMVGAGGTEFAPFQFDESAVRSCFGTLVKHVALSSVLDEMEALTSRELEESEQELQSQDYVVDTSDLDAVRRAGRAYGALKRILERGDFAAATLKARPELIDEHKLGMHAVCSRLTDTGIPTTCGGDIDGALTMLLLHACTGRPPFLGDWIQRDEKTNQVLFWSPGSAAASLVNPKHPLKIVSGLPTAENVGFSFPLKTGEVTVARLLCRRGKYKLLVARGRAVEPAIHLKGTYVTIRTQPPVQHMLTTILDHGFPHQYGIVYDDIKDELIELARQMSIEVVAPEEP